jgi:nitric oxide reductase NorD protein
MEEFVGGLWDRFITRSARRDHPEAAVKLADIEKMLGVLFRALGGDSGLRVAPASSQRHGARRRWLSRVAATDDRTALASLDLETLRLPPAIAYFPDRALNRDLFIWIIAAAAHEPEPSADSWIVRNQMATLRALKAFPGLRARYERLVAATLAERIAPEAMPADEAAQERAVRQALAEPGTVGVLPRLTLRKAKSLQAVPLWLYPSPLEGVAKVSRGDTPTEKEDNEEGRPEEVGVGDKRYQAERTEMPDNESAMIMAFRAESLLSWAEYIEVNRALDDDPNPDAKAVADDMDKLTVAQDSERVAAKVRFDLDLPSAAEDDLPLGPGIPLPEWDWKRHELRPDYCRLQVMQARHLQPIPLPEHLRRLARKLRNQFAALAPARRWLKAQPDGSELDIEACVRLQADRLAGQHFAGAGAYLSMVRRERDLASLVLADLSLSTDAWVSDSHRVIDVIRDSLMLFGEALSATGDRFAFHGFSSLRRGHVRFHDIKEFGAPFDAAARGRIAALKPGYYTRMGAGIRHATALLEKQPSALRLLLILSDGKPHDMDHYEGRYGIEDTRMALIDARRAGLKPFCVTIDREGASYLPHMFGPGGFTVLRKSEELPTRLPMLYAQLSQR